MVYFHLFSFVSWDSVRHWWTYSIENIMIEELADEE